MDVQGYADGRMSEAFLDIFCVPAGFEKLGGVGMAESMGGNGNIGIFGIASKKIAENILASWAVHFADRLRSFDFDSFCFSVFRRLAVFYSF